MTNKRGELCAILNSPIRSYGSYLAYIDKLNQGLDVPLQWQNRAYELKYDKKADLISADVVKYTCKWNK